MVISGLLFLLFCVIAGGTDIATGFWTLLHSNWFWLYMVIFAAPTVVGLYYWILLREEEITITDEFIARHSHWGDECLLWADIVAFRRRILPFKETRLGRITGLSRFLTRRKLFAKLPPIAYELVGTPDASGMPRIMSLEPGTVDDLPWLLELIEERIGPPQDVSLMSDDATTSSRDDTEGD